MRRLLNHSTVLPALALAVGLAALPAVAHADQGEPSWRLHHDDRWMGHREGQLKGDIHADRRDDARLDHREHYLGVQIGGLRSQETSIQDQIDGIHGHDHHDRKNRLEHEEDQLQGDVSHDQSALRLADHNDARNGRREGMAWWRLHHWQQGDSTVDRELGLP